MDDVGISILKQNISIPFYVRIIMNDVGITNLKQNISTENLSHLYVRRHTCVCCMRLKNIDVYKLFEDHYVRTHEIKQHTIEITEHIRMVSKRNYYLLNSHFPRHVCYTKMKGHTKVFEYIGCRHYLNHTILVSVCYVTNNN